MSCAEEEPRCQSCDRAIVPAEGFITMGLTAERTWCMRDHCLQHALLRLAADLLRIGVHLSPPRGVNYPKLPGDS